MPVITAANLEPHIGHLYTAVYADTLTRFGNLLQKDSTSLQVGTDCHGSKVQKSALNGNMDPLEFTAKNSSLFKHLFGLANVHYSRFVQTTDYSHKQTVASVWSKLFDRGLIKKGEHSGWYSQVEESFIPSLYITTPDTSNTEVVGSIAEYCKDGITGNVEWVNETGYKFDLEPYRNGIKEWLLSNPTGNYDMMIIVILPKSEHKLMVEMLSTPLQNLSISRPKDRVCWGIPVPNDQNATIYVWLDALMNYLPLIHEDKCTHIIGKDILKFHSIYWIAFLKALDEPLPNQIISHGHWLVDNKKMSKSDGNGVCPLSLLEIYHPDIVRFFLMRESGLNGDLRYNSKSIERLFKSELVNQLGNLVARCTSKKFQRPNGIKKEGLGLDNLQLEMLDNLWNATATYVGLMGQFKVAESISIVMSHLSNVNQYWGISEPWKMTQAQQDAVLYLTLESLRVSGILLQPVMPETCSKLLDAIGVPMEQRDIADAKTSHVGVFRIHQNVILFPIKQE